MALSSWPEPTRGRKDDDRDDLVNVTFEDAMFVAVVTDSAIGLKDSEGQCGVDIWLPISQIAGPELLQGSWVETITIPKWLADDKNLEYE